MSADANPAQSSRLFANLVPHRRVCLFCGGRATVFGPPDWDELDVDAEFASEGRSFSDVEDGDPIGVGCIKCSARRHAAALAS